MPAKIALAWAKTVPAESACLLACGVPTGLGAAVNTAARAARRERWP
jgi:Zn-dependent alcohol dehydrogenase